MKLISIYFIRYLNLSRNTAYNPMIYIPFFIVILIDKRGVREAERGGKRGDTRYDTRYEYTYDTPMAKEASTAPRSHRPEKKRYSAHRRHTSTPWMIERKEV